MYSGMVKKYSYFYKSTFERRMLVHVRTLGDVKIKPSKDTQSCRFANGKGDSVYCSATDNTFETGGSSPFTRWLEFEQVWCETIR